MPMTRLGRALVLAGQLNDETSRAEPDWKQIAVDSAELQRIAEALAALSPPRPDSVTTRSDRRLRRGGRGR
jgi:hypothetical protein